MNESRQDEDDAKALLAALSRIGPCDTAQGLDLVMQQLAGQRNTLGGKIYYIHKRINSQTKKIQYSIQCEEDLESGIGRGDK